MKIYVGFLGRISYIGFFDKPLLILIWGEFFTHCRPYIIIVLVDWIPRWHWGGDINWSHQNSVLPVFVQKINIDLFGDFQERILVSCFIQPILYVVLIQMIVLLYIYHNFSKKHIRFQILIPMHISHQTTSLKTNNIITTY